MILLVGYALNFDVKHIPLVIWDQGRSPESRAFSEKFRKSEFFEHAFDAYSYDEIESLVLHNRAKVALVIPTTFGNDLLSGNAPRVRILVDGSDANTSGQALSAANGVALSRSVEDLLARSGTADLPVRVFPQILFNPDSRSANLLIPGLVAILLTFSGTILAAFSILLICFYSLGYLGFFIAPGIIPSIHLFDTSAPTRPAITRRKSM